MAGQKRNYEDYRELLAPASSSTPFSVGRLLSHPAKSELKNATNDESSAGNWVTPKKRKKKVPKTESRNYPEITHSSSARLQSFVKIGDLQGLTLYILGDGNAPQWCAVKNKAQIRRVVIVMVPGLEAGLFDGTIPLAANVTSGAQSGEVKKGCSEDSQDMTPKTSIKPDDYYPVKLVKEQLPEPLKPFADMFPHIWPIKTPGDDKYSKVHSPLQAILNSPLPKSSEDRKKKGPQLPRGAFQSKRTPITKYLATMEELLENGYTIHPAFYKSNSERESAKEQREAAGEGAAHGWIDTPVEKLEDGNVPDKEVEQGSSTAGRDVLTLDCEMCMVEDGELQLARVSLIRWDGSVLMDELVKPERPITNYLTQYSGITEEMLRNVTTTLADIQKKLLEIITPRTILAGHSLESDLKSLKLTHPFIVDTSVLYPHPRGPPLKQALKFLTQKYLQRKIQQNHGTIGHDSVEDARASLELVKQKCEKGPHWGSPEQNVEPIFKRLARNYRPRAHQTSGGDEPRTGAVVDWGNPRKGHGAHAEVAIGCSDDAEVVEGVKKAVMGTEMGPEEKGIPIRGVDFVWARMRELEAVRGWWTRTKTADNAALLANALAGTKESAKEGEKQGEKSASTFVPAEDGITGDSTTTTNDTATADSSDPGPTTGPAADADIDKAAPSTTIDPTQLAASVKKTTEHLKAIYDSLPPCSTFIVYSGTGDPRETQRLQAMKQQWQREYRVKNWDDLSVKWTDVEDQALRKAALKAREGVGFVVVK